MSDNQDKRDFEDSTESTVAESAAESTGNDNASSVEGVSSDASNDGKVGAVAEADPVGDANGKGESSANKERVPAHPQHAQAKGSSSKIIGIVVAIVVAIVVIAICCFMFMRPTGEEAGQQTQVEELAVNDEGEESDYPPSPIDWEEWQGINDNVYAWVSVPDTGIELPVLQHPIAENFYLEHDIYGNSTIAGAIYSQKTYNSKDFQDDPVTVLYGHTFETNDTMFTQLHMLEDEVFFDEHPNFYIYTPEYNLTYEIISAYEWDNKLILAKYDVQNLDVQQEYFDIVADPDSTNKNVREMDRLIAGEDHIVQLSTCTVPSNSNKRYLVTGVLVNAERVSSDGVTVTEKDTAYVSDQE